MNDDYKRGYSKGYSTSARWPLHKPPIPPDGKIRALILALRELRDECDGICSTLCDDDYFVLALDPKISRADEALKALGAWLIAPNKEATPKAPPSEEKKMKARASAKAYYWRNHEKVLEAKRRYDTAKRSNVRGNRLAP